jgi:hypothetical protein
VSLRITRFLHPPALLLAVTLSAGGALAQQFPGAIFTTDKAGTAVNQNIYGLSTDVYLSGGPQNTNASGLSDGTYYFQVTDPSGNTLLSTDIALCRQLLVSGGRVAGATGPPCKHVNGIFDSASGTLPVQLFPFSPTPNTGNEFKAWLIAQTANTSVSGSDPKVLIFDKSDAKTDNFKVQQAVTPPPPGSCQPSNSLTVLVTGRNAVAYVPKGNWSVTHVTGVSVVNVEGTSVTPTIIPTPNVVNACAPNPISGQTVCSANNTDVYLISGTTLDSTLTSGGSGIIQFSGGSCTNCGVAMDAVHNKAVVGLSLFGTGGFQFLDLGPLPLFEPAIASKAPGTNFPANISEDLLIDPIRSLLLSPNERGNYEIVNVATSASPAFFENAVVGGALDSAGEECTTGIALAPKEFSGPSVVFIADLTQATFTTGSPGTWTAPSQNQSLSESFLSAGSSGIAVAQETHTGVVTGEFGGNTLTAIALPATSGSGTPAITDWVTCSIGNGFSNGFDPHTVTAYQSPNTGDAIAVLANGGPTFLAVVDLTKMLNTTFVPRTVAGHGCASGPLPATVVSFVSVP